MRRILVLACAVCLGVSTFANPADACHHRRARRNGYGDGGYAPAYYDGNYGQPAVPAPPAPPAPPPVPRAT